MKFKFGRRVELKAGRETVFLLRVRGGAETRVGYYVSKCMLQFGN